MLSLNFYFDESGNFEEHTLFEDGSIVRSESPQPGASQLVGVLIQSVCDFNSISEQILSLSYQKAGLTLQQQCHATNLRRQGGEEQYALLLSEFLNQLESNKIQPVRLCNSARLGFGGKITTYTSMVAEMVVRIFEELTREHGGISIGLDITAARVRTNAQDTDAPQIFIDEAEYTRRLNEQIAFAAVRRGVAHNRLKWSITGFRFGSGLRDRPLQVCDLLSNASYRNFKNCSKDQKKQLEQLFGAYDFPLNRSEVLEEIEQHRRDGHLAHAVQTIAENWNRLELEQNVRLKIKDHCSSIVKHLAEMPVSARNIQLRQLADWGSQFLIVRDLDMAASMFKWIEEHIAQPLCTSVNDPTLDDVNWFLAQMLILRLGQYNHRGELSIARPVCDGLQELFPLLAGQWEHASLLTEAMTLRAVHLNDCFEYDEASRLMGAVEGFYDSLSSLMADALPGVFPERVRSIQRGMALGTKLQSEMFAGLSDPTRLDDARLLNEMAIDEFSSENDRQRQYQYRCQIETFAGNLTDARPWLAKSLGIDKDSHSDLALAIKTLNGFAQGFALLHWSRIGMEAERRGQKDESKQFHDAFIYHKLDSSPWVKQQGQEYPAHGIRRHIAVALAIAGKYNECREMKERLAAMDTSGKIALTLIKLAGLLEVAARWPDDQADTIRAMINVSGKNKKSLLQEMRAFADSIAGFPSLHEIADELLTGIKQYESSSYKDARLLVLACRKVGQ